MGTLDWKHVALFAMAFALVGVLAWHGTLNGSNVMTVLGIALGGGAVSLGVSAGSRMTASRYRDPPD